MKFIENLLFYITVPKCASCGERLERRDEALCSKCVAEYQNELERNCSLCAKPLGECSCSNEYLDAHYVHKLVKVFRYKRDAESPSSRMIYSLKRDNRRDVLDFLSEQLAQSISRSVKNPGEYIFTSVPRRRSAIVKYGIDHAELLAKRTSAKLGAKYKKLLISRAKTEQKKSKNREERLKNADFRLKKESMDLTGESLILIDDIVTTGASMSAASMNLKAVGAKKIIGASLAIAYKDDYAPFERRERFVRKKRN